MSTFDRAELDALLKRLKEMNEKVAKKELRKAARKAMNIVKKDAQDHAPVDSGLLERNFALSVKVKNGTVVARVGVKGGAVENPTTPFYFRFDELGTEKQPAKPFLRPALENNAQQVFDTLTDQLIQGIDKA